MIETETQSPRPVDSGAAKNAMNANHDAGGALPH
jgi:hypothetical protein